MKVTFEVLRDCLKIKLGNLSYIKLLKCKHDKVQKNIKYAPSSYLNQNGRSMVEMLGVLAIIGILSVMALIGYTYAISKQQANMILNDVNLMLTTYRVYELNHLIPDGKILNTEDLAVDTSFASEYFLEKEDSGYFHIIATEVPYGACNILIDENLPYIEEIAANITTSGTCEKDEKNEVYFYANADMDADLNEDRFERCSSEKPCPGTCHICVRGRCMESDEKCPEGQTCYLGECSPCPKDSFAITDASCQRCSSTATYLGPTTVTECNKCSDRFFANDNSCAKCYGVRTLLSAKEQCDRCSERAFFGSDHSNGSCVLCEGGWDITNVLKEECDQCPKRVFMGSGASKGSCIDCNVFGYNHASEADCFKCPNTIWYRRSAGAGTCARCEYVGGKPNGDRTQCICPNGQFWHLQDTQHQKCGDCSNTRDPAATNKWQCDKCPNRIFFSPDENNPVGWCGTCEGMYNSMNSTKAQCDKCPNRYFIGNNDANGSCNICNGTVSADGRRCE